MDRGFELVTRGLKLVTHGFERVTRGFGLVTRGLELVTRRFELVTRGFTITLWGIWMKFSGKMWFMLIVILKVTKKQDFTLCLFRRNIFLGGGGIFSLFRVKNFWNFKVKFFDCNVSQKFGFLFHRFLYPRDFYFQYKVFDSQKSFWELQNRW